MLRRLILACAALMALAAAPARALDLEAMDATDKAAFGAAVRAYLMENPEVLMEVIGELESRQAAAQAADDATLIELHAGAIYDDGFSHVTGNPDGDVTIVEFVDYRCGYCRRAFPEVQELIESDGNIRLILKEFPILGADSVLAARFAISAQIAFGEEAYGKLHDAMMTMRGNVSETALVALADGLELDGAAILAAMDTPAVDQAIGANHQLAALLKVTGTPGYVIGDQVLRGYLPLDGMRGVVAEVRAAQGN